MPELPEVETVRTSLEPILTGRTLEHVEIRDGRLTRPFDPVVVAAEPLWRLGGYRLTLLLPMIGAIGAAFAARAIADRIVPGRGWPAFWITGLASAATIYALDFWEQRLRGEAGALALQTPPSRQETRR